MEGIGHTQRAYFQRKRVSRLVDFCYSTCMGLHKILTIVWDLVLGLRKNNFGTYRIVDDSTKIGIHKILSPTCGAIETVEA